MKRNSETGYLLIETIVLAAIVLAAAGTIFLYQLGLRHQQNGRADIAADYLALEQLAYLEITDSGTRASVTGWLGDAAQLEQNGVAYQISSSIAPSSHGTQIATVTVSWRENSGKTRERKLVRRLEGLP